MKVPFPKVTTPGHRARPGQVDVFTRSFPQGPMSGSRPQPKGQEHLNNNYSAIRDIIFSCFRFTVNSKKYDIKENNNIR